MPCLYNLAFLWPRFLGNRGENQAEYPTAEAVGTSITIPAASTPENDR